MVLGKENQPGFPETPESMMELARELISIAMDRVGEGQGVRVGSTYEKIVVLQRRKAIYKLIASQLKKSDGQFVPDGPQDRGLSIFGYMNCEDRLTRLAPLELPRDPKLVDEKTLEGLRGVNHETIETIRDHLQVAKRVSTDSFPKPTRVSPDFSGFTNRARNPKFY